MKVTVIWIGGVGWLKENTTLHTSCSKNVAKWTWKRDPMVIWNRMSPRALLYILICVFLTLAVISVCASVESTNMWPMVWTCRRLHEGTGETVGVDIIIIIKATTFDLKTEAKTNSKPWKWPYVYFWYANIVVCVWQQSCGSNASSCQPCGNVWHVHFVFIILVCVHSPVNMFGTQFVYPVSLQLLSVESPVETVHLGTCMLLCDISGIYLLIYSWPLYSRLWIVNLPCKLRSNVLFTCQFFVFNSHIDS